MENVKCECKLCNEKDPKDMTPEELEIWREAHDPDCMGYVGKEGVDDNDHIG